ncbi:MAG: hypothetical protein JWO68_3501 [Actinomycetia bacterium]|nr:hypothetical protein [Actinomycetes bacterium]
MGWGARVVDVVEVDVEVEVLAGASVVDVLVEVVDGAAVVDVVGATVVVVVGAGDDGGGEVGAGVSLTYV